MGEWFSYGNRREHFLPEVRSVIEKKAQFLTEIKKCDRKESAAERSFAHSGKNMTYIEAVSYTHLRAHETDSYLVCRLLLEKKKTLKTWSLIPLF